MKEQRPEHICDRSCACPGCGRPMLYHRRSNTHACADFDCEHSRTTIIVNSQESR